MNLRLRIGALMNERGMSISDLKKKAGIAQNTARDLYRGTNTRVDLDVLMRVAKALEVRPLELFEEVENNESGNSLQESLAA